MTFAVHPSDANDRTLVELMVQRASAHGDRMAMAHLDRGERLAEGDRYADLDRHARAVASFLVASGLKGRPVLLCLPSGLDFVRCFLGGLYGRSVVAPAPGLETRRGVERAVSIARDLVPAAVITPRGAVPAALSEALPPGCLLIEAPDAMVATPLAVPVHSTPDDLAFIQYTSGSVGTPRGIAVTHRNIMANQAMISTAFGHDPSLVVVNWLPLHHDMGLCGSILQTLYMGGRCISMSPLAFLQKPLRWLRAVHEHGGTSSGGPNFAFELCTRFADAEKLRTLDLSTWKVAFCGAEPIRPNVLRAFASAFVGAGFDARSLHPCYGLAEGTLFVSSATPGTGLRTRQLATESASCGRTFGDSRIAILGPDGNPLPDGSDGEVAISGSNVSPGFWNAAMGTAQPDPAREENVDGIRFLRTGDIGTLVEGDLHILGRRNDTIIVRGLKLHAEDIEATILATDGGTRFTAAAAFALHTDSGDHLVVVCEAPRKPEASGDSLAITLAAHIGEIHGLVPRHVMLVRSGAIPRSINGKIRRSACREAYLSGSLASAVPVEGS